MLNPRSSGIVGWLGWPYQFYTNRKIANIEGEDFLKFLNSELKYFTYFLWILKVKNFLIFKILNWNILFIFSESENKNKNNPVDK